MKCGKKSRFAAMMAFVIFAAAGFAGTAEARGGKNNKAAFPERQHSIVKIAALTANGDLDNLYKALNEGLDNDLSINEIKEILIQMYAYTGFPRSLNAANTFISVLNDRKTKGITDREGPQPDKMPENANKFDLGTQNLAQLTGNPVSKNTAAYALFVPDIEVFLKEHLFADIFSRGVLSNLDREIATISALASLGNVNEQMRSHMNISMYNGMTEEQGCEFINIIKKNIGSRQGKNAETVFKELVESRTK